MTAPKSSSKPETSVMPQISALPSGTGCSSTTTPARLQSSWQDVSNGNLAFDIADLTEDTKEKSLLSLTFPSEQFIFVHRFKEIRRCVELAFHDPEAEPGLRQWHQAHCRIAALGNHHVLSAQRGFDQLRQFALGGPDGMNRRLHRLNVVGKARRDKALTR